MYQHHATATRSRRDLASNLGKTAFVLSKTTSVRVGSGLFEQTGTLKGVALSTAGPNGRGYKKIKSRPYRALHGFRRAVERLVANPSAVNESAPGLHSFGRTIAAPALNIRSRCNIFGMVRLCGMNLPGVFVVGCCIVGADAAGSISG